MMSYSLAERGKSEDTANHIEMTIEEGFSGQYIRFRPTEAWRPNINIYETEEAVVICMDVAGMKPEEIQVDVEGDTLVLRGERPRPMPEPRTSAIGVHLMEIDTGVFCRELDIPSSVDRDKIIANYSDGLLWITLPKT